MTDTMTAPPETAIDLQHHTGGRNAGRYGNAAVIFTQSGGAVRASSATGSTPAWSA